MSEKRPLDSPDGNWWDHDVNRREAMWLGVSGVWASIIFGWMLGWTEFGGQNPIGPTERISTENFRESVSTFKERAGEATIDGDSVLVPPESDLYVGAYQWDWDGLPAVIEAGTTYTFHLGAYDVQHGFSVRDEENLSQQMSLQILPDYEWKVDMNFDEPGTYHVVCNEFCGVGHRTMHGKLFVREELPDVEFGSDGNGSEDGSDESADYGGWFTADAEGGPTENYDGKTVDATDQDSVTVTVGPEQTFTFDPPAVRISSGTTVAFEWASNTHNVLVHEQPDGASWDGHEPIENEGFSFEHTFDTAGTYKYYCNPHLSAGMKGVIEVE